MHLVWVEMLISMDSMLHAQCIDKGDYAYKTMNLYDAQYYAENVDDNAMDWKEKKKREPTK